MLTVLSKHAPGANKILARCSIAQYATLLHLKHTKPKGTVDSFLLLNTLGTLATLEHMALYLQLMNICVQLFLLL